jgi:hypothetical protein
VIRPEAEAYYFPESVQRLILELEKSAERRDELEEQVRLVLGETTIAYGLRKTENNQATGRH